MRMLGRPNFPARRHETSSLCTTFVSRKDIKELPDPFTCFWATMSRSKMIRKQRIPIPCGVAGCTVTCLRRGDMRRHKKEFHGHKVYCLMPNCNFRGAKRRYRFKAHFLKYHTRHHLGTLLHSITSCFTDSFCAVNLNIPMNDDNWPETPQPSDCQMPFYHQAFGE